MDKDTLLTDKVNGYPIEWTWKHGSKNLVYIIHKGIQKHCVKVSKSWIHELLYAFLSTHFAILIASLGHTG